MIRLAAVGNWSPPALAAGTIHAGRGLLRQIDSNEETIVGDVGWFVDLLSGALKYGLTLVRLNQTEARRPIMGLP